MSFLSAVAKVPVAIFHFITSAKGQSVISESESVIETLFPQLKGVFDIVNSWMQKIITTETIAAAAGQQDGTGAQKAAAVLVSIQPELSKYFPTMAADKVAEVNTHLVAILNLFDGEAKAS